MSGRCARALAKLAAVLALFALLAPAVARADEAARQRALELYDRGKASFQAGRFEESLGWLEQAYAVEPAPVLLYNMGRAHEARGDLGAAIAAYDRYLRQAEQVPDRAAIEAHLVALRAQLAERERPAAPSAAARRSVDAPPAPSASSPSATPWVVAGVGVAGVGAGVVLGVLALAQHDDAQAAAQADAPALQGRAEDLGTASTVALVVGGVVAGAGISWALVDGLGSGAPSARARGTGPRLAVGPLSISLRGAF
jgi:tetratricopeptide (TPR) repeat protein